MNSGRKQDNQLRSVVVSNAEQLAHAYSVRSICFMVENGLSVRQTFDGNDFQATHIVMYAGDEPIGATRVRWFSDFAKIERTAFRPEYRDIRVLRKFSEFVFGHVAQKGYRKLLTHAEEKYARLWVKFLGFEFVESKPPVLTEGQEPFYELVRHLKPPQDCITAESEPAVLFRIEGAWDAPSAFENQAR